MSVWVGVDICVYLWVIGKSSIIACLDGSPPLSLSGDARIEFLWYGRGTVQDSFSHKKEGRDAFSRTSSQKNEVANHNKIIISVSQ